MNIRMSHFFILNGLNNILDVRSMLSRITSDIFTFRIIPSFFNYMRKPYTSLPRREEHVYLLYQHNAEIIRLAVHRADRVDLIAVIACGGEDVYAAGFHGGPGVFGMAAFAF